MSAGVADTWAGPLPGRHILPASVDVVVIGGGIVGVSTAWFLARQGRSVLLCEKGHIAGEQSGRNWGWVRAQGRDPRELPMMLDSLRTWRALATTIGEDVGYRERGCTFTARSEQELAALEDWAAIGRAQGMDTRLLSRNELRSLYGESASAWCGAMFTASDGRAEPQRAAPALARAARREGATVLTGCAVRGLQQSAGQTSGVVTEYGSVSAPVVVCAAGAWTSLFCASLGIALPQLTVRGTVARTAPFDGILDGDLFDHTVGIRRRDDGGFTVAHGSILEHFVTPASFRWFGKFLPALKQDLRILRLRFGRAFIDALRTPSRWPLDETTPFEKRRVLDPAPSPSVLKKLRRNVDALFPALRGVPFVESWAGMIEASPDVVPIIDEALPGFYVATGFSGHGFGIGPGAGRAIAALVSGAQPEVDLGDFRLQRFFDGSPIRPQASI